MSYQNTDSSLQNDKLLVGIKSSVPESEPSSLPDPETHEDFLKCKDAFQYVMFSFFCSLPYKLFTTSISNILQTQGVWPLTPTPPISSSMWGRTAESWLTPAPGSTATQITQIALNTGVRPWPLRAFTRGGTSSRQSWAEKGRTWASRTRASIVRERRARAASLGTTSPGAWDGIAEVSLPGTPV